MRVATLFIIVAAALSAQAAPVPQGGGGVVATIGKVVGDSLDAAGTIVIDATAIAGAILKD